MMVNTSEAAKEKTKILFRQLNLKTVHFPIEVNGNATELEDASFV